MRIFIKSLKVLFKTCAVLFGLAVALYLVAVVVNWNDQPPSETALQFEEYYANRKAIPDEDNGYVYAMGFEVAEGENPTEMGARRIAWSDQQKYFLPDLDTDPISTERYSRVDRSKGVEQLYRLCTQANHDCLNALEASPDSVTEWLESEQWLLDRYRVLLAHADWQETARIGLFSSLLISYGDIINGQKLLLLQAWVLADQGHAAGASSLLAEDIRFWRMQLAKSDLYISKMIAVSTLQRQFFWGNLILRKLLEDTAMSSIPAHWVDPISDEERSMEKVYRGEWMFSLNYAQEFFYIDSLEILSGSGIYSEIPLKIRLQDLLSRPVFQPQDTSNKSAELATKATETLNVPYANYAQALESLQEQESQTLDDVWPMHRTLDFYNIMGDSIVAISGSLYSSYSPRAADLEGIRRAALATIQMRSLRTPEDQAAQFLNSSEFKNPYDGSPFVWEEASGSVVFTGLGPDDRVRSAFLY